MMHYLTHLYIYTSAVATISRLLKSQGLFCKRAPSKREYSAEETYHLKEPTHRSHPITHQTKSQVQHYGLATISRLLKMVGLFCKRAP